MPDIATPDLLHLLHEVSPYEGYDCAAHPADLQGWGSQHPMFEAVITAQRPGIIVEVGTWKGASAIHMGQIIRALGLPTRIICVDTWLGSPEHFLGGLPEWRQSLRLKNGYPQLYFTFLTNVVEHGLSDIIIPLPASSESGAIILSKKQIRPDLVYLDAAHDYVSVARDLRLYWSLLSDSGLLLGDDFDLPYWPEVRRAVVDFAREHKLQIGDCGTKFLLSKRPFTIHQGAPTGPS